MHLSYAILATLSTSSVVLALPHQQHARRQHHHVARRPEPTNYNLGNVNWGQALQAVDWSAVKFNGKSPAPTPVAEQKEAETTVAVVGAAAPTPPPAAAKADVTVASMAPVANNLAVDATIKVDDSTSKKVSLNANANAKGNVNVNTKGSGRTHYNVNVINQCPETIWQAGWQTNTAGALIDNNFKGNEMAAGSSISLSVPLNALGVQIWARQGCSSSKGNFHCAVGDCQGFKCSSIIWQKGPILAEFGAGLNTGPYDTAITAYDISAIPGNNVGVKIVPSVGSCQTKLCPKSGCSIDQAWQRDEDIALGSPADTVCTNTADFTVTFCPSTLSK